MCCVERTETDECNKCKIYTVYSRWCQDNRRKDVASKSLFKQELEKAGYGEIKKINGTQYYARFTLSDAAKDEYSYLINK